MDSRKTAELQKKNFTELKKNLENFYGSCCEVYILVSWSEPDNKMNWTKYDGYGPLNQSFFRWLNQHWDYWQDKACVCIAVEEIHRDKKSDRRTW